MPAYEEPSVLPGVLLVSVMVFTANTGKIQSNCQKHQKYRVKDRVLLDKSRKKYYSFIVCLWKRFKKNVGQKGAYLCSIKE